MDDMFQMMVSVPRPRYKLGYGGLFAPEARFLSVISTRSYWGRDINLDLNNY